MKLVLLPGLNGTDDLFPGFIDALPGHISVQVISYPVDTTYDYPRLVDLVRGLLPDDEDYILVGESFSAVIALQVAAAAPPGLRAVVFVAGFLRSPRPLLLQLGRLVPLSALFALPLPAWAARAFCLGPDADTRLVKQLQAVVKKLPAAVLAARLRLVGTLQCATRLAGVRAVYLRANGDRLVPNGDVHFREQVQNLQVVELDGPHFLLQTRPQQCATVISELLADQAEK